MANDNLALALTSAATGLLEGSRDILVPYFLGKIEKKQRIDALREELDLKRIPAGRVSKLAVGEIDTLSENDMLYPEESAIFLQGLREKIAQRNLLQAEERKFAREKEFELFKGKQEIPKEERLLGRQKELLSFKEGLKSEKEGKKEIRAADVGRDVLAEESIVGIKTVRKLLFPKDTVKSFKRGAALKSKIPLIGAAPFSFEGQEIRRLMRTAIAGRQLIQTGVAARPDEVELLVDNFIAGATSNPRSAYNALNQLETFYKNYRAGIRNINTEIEDKDEEIVKEMNEFFKEFE